MDILNVRKFTFTLSTLLVIASVILLGVLGLRPGIDFTGGSLMEVEFTGERPSVEEIIAAIEDAETESELGSVVVQPAGESGAIIRLQFLSEQDHQVVLAEVRDTFGSDENPVIEERFETVGSSVSASLRDRSLQIGVFVILAIILYIAFAFRRVSKPVASWKYGLTAIAALVHDVLIVIGVFAILGRVYGVEVGIPFVVALLTIMGYSVNDTIVLFDRVRENLLSLGPNKFTDAVRAGVKQSITRSINTSITTLLVLVALYIFSGESIRWFAFALIIGILSGTYSSIFLASPLLVEWVSRKEKTSNKGVK